MNDAHRKARLRHLIATDYGRQADFVRASGMSKSRLSQIVGPSEPFGEEAARRLAHLLQLPEHWFNLLLPTPKEERTELKRGSANTAPAPFHSEAPPSYANVIPGPATPASPTLAQALEVVACALMLSDDLTRDQVRPLLARLVDEPGRAPEIVPRIDALLAAFAAQSPGTETHAFAGKPTSNESTPTI